MDVSERPKRQKRESANKSKAFEKLKQIKSGGGKNKYEVTEMDNVYEEVSEKEYTERVLKRQRDDWIVDDFGGDGYVEDGREIFDDDLDEQSIEKEKKVGKKRDHSGKPKNVEPPTGNIQKMLANMPTKKKKEVKLEDDDLLGSLMSELDDSFKPENIKKKVSSEKEYLDRFQRTAPAMKRPMPVKKPMTSVTNVCDRTEKVIKTPVNEVEKESSVVIEPEHTSKKVTNNKEDMSLEMNDDMDVGMLEVDEMMNEWDDPFVTEPDQTETPVKPAEKQNAKKEEKKIEEQLNSEWETMTTSNENETNVSLNIDYSQLPLVDKEDGKKSFKFYYWDSHEEPFNQPGTIYLFGKVWVESSNTYASCCVTVRNIERRVFLLPRQKKYDAVKKEATDEDVKLIDVYNEFNEKISERYRISKFKSRKVTKNYAFNIPDIPDSSDYLEVRYSANFNALPSTLTGETFSHVFGTNTAFLELFLIERRIKGPCWLDLTEPLPGNPLVSWCKFEVMCNDMNNISVIINDPTPPPPLVVLTLNTRITSVPKSHENQITMIGCLVQNSYHTDRTAPSPLFQQHFCVFTRPNDIAWPYDSKEVLSKCTTTKLERMDSERALLNFFLAKFHRIDPDLIVGHDIYGFDIGTLIHRLTTNKIMHWSRLGRLRRATVPNMGKSGRSFLEKSVMCGRLICDVKLSAKELIKARSYDLDSLCQQVLHIQEGAREDVGSEEVKEHFRSSQSLIKLLKLTMQDAAYILRIMYELNVIPLSLQITNIAGNILSRTLMGGRAERNEYLLLHAFNDKNYIVPDKVYGKKGKDEVSELSENMNGLSVGKGKRKPQYEGGMVLEPKRGFYDKFILLMDFNSLYPSIIQEYNICFTTVCVRAMNCDEGDLVSLMNYLPSTTDRGILPTEIRKLVESRREVKKLMAKPDISQDSRHQYDIRQLALKLTANSMYGCLGFPNSRFYAKPLAAMVTAKGREILTSTRDLVQRLNFDVIYGDTDSLMINTNCFDYDQVFKVGQQIKVEVNKLYKQIELDIDGVFKYMLLLKKKKYAAVTMSKVKGKIITKQEIKGLDIVRRDWSQLSCETGKIVLNQILCDQVLEEKLANIHATLERIKTDINEGKVPVTLLAITRQLTKNPEDYPDKKALPHVQVALRMNQTLTKKMKQGDTVQYVICEDGTNQAATQRAYHIDELKNNDKLKIDTKYYLSQQIHPVITRLCEPIDGIDAVQIAESLGLEIAAYQHIRRIDANNEENDDVVLDEADKFKNCDKFEFKCLHCSKLNVIEIPVIKNENEPAYLALAKCTNLSCSASPIEHINQLQNKLSLMIRSFIHKYYVNWMVCEELTCASRTRVIKEINKNRDPLCHACKKSILKREYTELDLYNQLNYFHYLFDITMAVSKFKLNIPHDGELYKNYCKLKKQVDSVLDRNAYNIIDFAKIAEHMLMKKSVF